MTDLERMARAIAYSSDVSYERIPAHYKRKARAALEALMEPSDGMLDAGITADHGNNLGERVTNCWQAMIRHILEEGGK